MLCLDPASAGGARAEERGLDQASAGGARDEERGLDPDSAGQGERDSIRTRQEEGSSSRAARRISSGMLEMKELDPTSAPSIRTQQEEKSSSRASSQCVQQAEDTASVAVKIMVTASGDHGRRFRGYAHVEQQRAHLMLHIEATTDDKMQWPIFCSLVIFSLCTLRGAEDKERGTLCIMLHGAAPRTGDHNRAITNAKVTSDVLQAACRQYLNVSAELVIRPG